MQALILAAVTCLRLLGPLTLSAIVVSSRGLQAGKCCAAGVGISAAGWPGADALRGRVDLMTAGPAEYVSFLGSWRRAGPCCAGEGVEGDAGSSVRLKNPACPSLARQDLDRPSALAAGRNALLRSI